MNSTITTYWGSIAVKKQMRFSFSDRLFLSIALTAVIVLSFPHITLATTVRDTPLYFDVENIAPIQTAKAEIVDAEVEQVFTAPAMPDPRVSGLQRYLEDKRSPMAPYAETLLGQYHYRLIIGISFAESNFCKYNIRPYNCWGIGGGRPESYADYPAAFERADQLIERYHNRGMTTPKTMRTTWVGWHNDNWIIAVEQVIREMEAAGL